MREIKFRVWDEKNNKYLKRPENIRMNISNGNLHGRLSEGNVPVWRAEQYTGLKDKNGNEIYEGDVLDIDDTEDDSQIKIVFKAPSFCKMSTKEQFDYCIRLDRFDVELYIISGNIHQTNKLNS